MRITFWKNISVLRGVAICAVVFAHASNVSFGPFLRTIDTISFANAPIKLAVLFFIRSISNIGVLSFVFVSGYMAFRMYSGPKSTNRNALDLLKKYLLWAVPLTVLVILLKRDISIFQGIINLIIGGPMPAYWFFVLIIILLLACPFFVFLVKEHIRIAASLMILLQILVFMRYYYIDFSPPLLIEKLLFRSLTFSPPFIFGMIAAKKTQDIIELLKNHRHKLIYLVIFSMFLCIVESLAISNFNSWNPAKIQSSFATERMSLNLLFIAAAMYILMQEDKPSGLRSWLTKVGIASFGIFLMTDIYNMFLNMLIWHLPLDWIGLAGTHLNSNSSIPAWLPNTSLWFLPLYFINGLYLPLLTMRFAKKYLGKRVSALW